MVAGTFHVPSAIQKPLVFVALALGKAVVLFARCKTLSPFAPQK